MRLGIAAFILAVGLSPASASDLASCSIPAEAQAAEGCLCVFSPAPPVALLDQITGKILKSSTAEYTPVVEKAPLVLGDSVLFAGDGSALLKGVNCEQLVGPNASLVIRPLDNGCACAALITDPKAAALVGGHGAALAVAGGAALLGLAIATHSVSP